MREAQAATLPLLLEGERDVVIAAATTASGKTEAAFLSLLTRLWRDKGKDKGQSLLLYVAPMKALINDQHERLGLICERLELPVTPWHGDGADAAQTLLRRSTTTSAGWNWCRRRWGNGRARAARTPRCMTGGVREEMCAVLAGEEDGKGGPDWLDEKALTVLRAAMPFRMGWRPCSTAGA